MIADTMLFTLDSRVVLNNGVEIPRLGLGVYQSPPGKATENDVSYALMLGYRLIDTEARRMLEERYEKVESEGKKFSSLQRSGTATKDTNLLCKHATRA